MDICFYVEEDCKKEDIGQTLQDQLIEERKICKRLGDALIHCTKEHLKVTQQLMVERHHLNLVVMEIRKLRLEVLDWRTIVDILVAEIKVMAPFMPIIEDEGPMIGLWSKTTDGPHSEYEEDLEVTPETIPIAETSAIVDDEVGKHWLDADDAIEDNNEITYSDVEAMLAEPAIKKPVPKKDKIKKPVPKKDKIKKPVPKKEKIKRPIPKKDKEKKPVTKKIKKSAQTKKKKDESKQQEESPWGATEEYFVKGLNGYQCKICKKVISARAYLSHHLLRHKRTKFRCDFCSREFRDKAKMRDHVMYIHFKVPRERSTCEICGKTFQTMQNVKRHKTTAHRSERPFLCDLCGKGFNVKSTLKQHMEGHEKKEDKTYTCRHCDLEFKDRVQMFKHRKTHPVHISRQCDVCGLVLPTVTLLWQHWKTHPEKLRFPCDLCEKVFASKSSLNFHKGSAAHSYKPATCNVCDKTFAHRNSLRTHLQRHHKKCETCGKEFKLVAMLEEHSYVHTGIPPFKCTVCSAEFIDRKLFWKHKLTHAEFRPHICDICGNRFPSVTYLNHHTKLHQKWGKYIPPGGKTRRDGQPPQKRSRPNKPPAKPPPKRELSYFEELIWRR